MTPPSRQADRAHGLPGRELIAVMPLHAITTVYGERGLRARLEFEAARLDSPAEREKTGRALQLAARLHERDERQREPYINHYADLRIMPILRGGRLVAALRAAGRSA
jgi:hypothetical protein